MPENISKEVYLNEEDINTKSCRIQPKIKTEMSVEIYNTNLFLKSSVSGFSIYLYEITDNPQHKKIATQAMKYAWKPWPEKGSSILSNILIM